VNKNPEINRVDFEIIIKRKPKIGQANTAITNAGAIFSGPISFMGSPKL
jgi:hypothetical protein